MGAVWARVRAELRRRWRGVVGLALVAGIAAAPVVAMTAGARRTESAYPRFLRQFRGADLNVDNLGPTNLEPAAIARLPGVDDIEPFHWAIFDIRGDFSAGIATSRDRLGPALDRFKIVEGRAPNPARPEEAVLSLAGRDKHILRVGDRFPLRSFPIEPFGPFNEALKRNPMTMRIVGVAAAPGGFPPQVSEPGVWFYLTPAFYRMFPNAFPWQPGSLIRLDQRKSMVDAFEKAFGELAGIGRESVLELAGRAGQNENVQRSLHVQSVALWIIAAIAGGAFLLIFGQLFSRQVFLDSRNSATLRALGMSGGQLWAASTATAAVTGLAGALVAVGIAAALSPIFPLGLARIAEPRPGFSIDAITLVLGGLATILASVVLTAVPALREVLVSRRSRAREPAERASRTSSLLARLGAGPSTVSGVRMAFERGRGATAVPVRTTIAGVTIGLAAISAAITFGSSLRTLNANPRLSGVGWDMAVAQDSTDFSTQGSRLLSLPEVQGVSAASTGLSLAVDGQSIGGVFAMDAIAGGRPPLPPLINGRAPAQVGTAEIALGPRTIKRLDVSVGDEVRVESSLFTRAVEMRIVGSGPLPSTSETRRSGEGAWISRRAVLDLGLLRLGGEGEGGDEARVANYALLAVRPGTDRKALLEKIAHMFHSMPDNEVYVPPFATSSDLANYRRIERMPDALAGILGLISAAALVHALVTAIRRRRRDLAILKTLGFVRRQVRTAIGVQATALVVVAFVVGVPAGLIVGRVVWRGFSSYLGVIPEPVVPQGYVLAVIPVVIVLANLIATLPARAAARTRPAPVLRSE